MDLQKAVLQAMNRPRASQEYRIGERGEIPELAGPPAPNRQPYTADDIEGQETPTKEGVLKTLMPLLAGQAADLVSTEQFRSTGLTEGNPLPGMQSTGGRLAWGALEDALMALLAKKAPGVAKYVVPATGLTHTVLADHNTRFLPNMKGALYRGAKPE